MNMGLFGELPCLEWNQDRAKLQGACNLNFEATQAAQIWVGNDDSVSSEYS
jgi:hypothetical protein